MNTLTQNGATDKSDTPTAFVVGVSFLYLFYIAVSGGV